MRASREQSQHAGGVSRVARFAEDFFVDHDDGIRSEHAVLRTATRNCKRFLPSESLRTFHGQFAIARTFVDVGGLYREGNTSTPQKLLAARRGGGENERHERSL
jgi:hypothetical protein